MTIEEIQAKILKCKRRIDKLYGEITNFQVQLRTICDHQNPEVYQWEHDNGYGRQSWIKGKRCVHCGFIDAWSNGNFQPREHWTF